MLNLLKFLVRPRDGSELRAEQVKILEGAVDQIFLEPIAEPPLCRRREPCCAGASGQGTRIWPRGSRSGPMRGDGCSTTRDAWTSGNGVFGFDLTKVLDDDDIRTAALGYIFHRVEGLMDGAPMMLFIDEGWKILNDDKFSGFVTDKLKTIRKLNGIVGFGTQSAKDIVASKMAHTLIEQTPTNLFFPEPEGRRRLLLIGFKLSRAELDWVRSDAAGIAPVPDQARPGFGDRAARSLGHARPRKGSLRNAGARRGDGEPDGALRRSARTMAASLLRERAMTARKLESLPPRRRGIARSSSIAFAQVPVADAARLSQERSIASCMTAANGFNKATVPADTGTQGSVAAPAATNATPTASVGASNVTGWAGTGAGGAGSAGPAWPPSGRAT